jgi:hypothetical protein
LDLAGQLVAELLQLLPGVCLMTNKQQTNNSEQTNTNPGTWSLVRAPWSLVLG